MSDPFEEFEFKPLTNGLGFHKKAINLKDETDTAEIVEQKVSRSVPTVPSDLLADEPRQQEASNNRRFEDMVKEYTDKQGQRDSGIQWSQPLKREEPKPELPQPAEVPAEPATLKEDLNIGRQINEEFIEPSESKEKARIEPQLVKAATCFPAAILDGVIILGLSLLFLVALLLVTKVDLIAVMFNAQADPATQIGIVVLFLAVMQIYMIISRSFFGCTLGEWAFEVQLGNNKHQKSAFYPILVVWRSVLVLLTGVFIFPVLSFILRRDLMYYITGTQLYRKTY